MQKSTHHHHSGKKQLPQYMRILLMGVFLLAFFAFIPYLPHKFVPFLRSIAANHKINVSTISYTALRIALMIVPLVFAVPGFIYREYIEKPKLISRWLNIVSFLYFVGMVADIITYNVIGSYVDDGSDPIMLKLLWNNAGTMAILFCMIQGVLYLIMSKMMSGHKKPIVMLYAMIVASNIAMPLLYDVLRHALFNRSWNVWYAKNVYFFISQIITLAGLIFAGTSRKRWSAAIWN